jgi:HEAT repeat protein
MQSDSLFHNRPRLVSPTGVIGLALTALVILMAMPSQALAEGGSVRYNYVKLDLPGGVRYGLVPVGEHGELAGKLTKSRVFDAFNLLKDDKAKTYGRTSIRISGSFSSRANINRAEVSVKIDPEKANLAPIIMAETVYTLTGLGIKAVEFPNYFKGGMTREDVPFDAYTLTMPLWRALPPANAAHAQVRLPDGTLIATSEFNKRWKSGDKELREGLFSYLDDSQVYTVVQVLHLLPKLDVDYTAEVIPLLAHDSTSVQKRALSVLEAHRNDDAVLSAVYAMMTSNENDAMARKAAEFLGEAKSIKMNVYKDLFLLDRGTEKEAVAAADALGKRKGDPRVVKRLYAHLSDKSGGDQAGGDKKSDKPAKLSLAAAQALEVLEADERQIAALTDTNIAPDLRLSMARTLAEDGDDSSKLVGLKYIGEKTTGRSAELAIRSLGTLKSTQARKTVEEFLGAKTRRKRLTAADVLVENGDVASLDALADAVAKGKDAYELEKSAYELLVAQSLDTVLGKTESSDKVIKRLAYRAVGDLAVKQGAGAKVFDKLEKGTRSRDAAIGGASARALGSYADDKALAILKTLADDKRPEVRAGVAHGLSHFKKGQMFDTLATYLDDSSPEVVAAAVAAMEARSEATKWDKIKNLAEAKDPRVRANALRALSQLVSRDDQQGVRIVMSMLGGAVSDDSRIVQLTALRQLSTFEDDNAPTSIAILLNSADPTLRVAAIEALGETGHASAAELVLSVLQDPNPDIRRAAIVALGELEAKSAAPQLKALLDKEDDPELKKLIQRTLRQI